jgi:3-oxoadipate enol-lactonase
MPYLSVEKEELYYQLESGDLNKVIVFLHSLGTDHRVWKYQVEKFSQEGYTIVVPDARGHGRSSCHGGVSVDLWVSDLLNILNHLKIGKVVLCGVSMGGVEAMAFTLKHPERVRALVLADTFAKIDPNTVDDKIKFTAGVAQEQGMDRYADTYLDNTLSATPTATEIHKFLRQAISGMTVEVYASSAESCFRIDVEEQLGAISVPTLVLIGEEDFKTPINLSQTIAGKIPNAKLHIVSKGRHLSNIDEPESFNQLLLEFIKSL